MAQKRVTDLLAAAALTGDELVGLSQLSTVVKITAATISALASDNSFNDSGTGFVAAGFAENDRVSVSGFTGNVANNIIVGTITALTAGKMIIGGTDCDVIVDDAAGETVTIAKWTSKRVSVEDLVPLPDGLLPPGGTTGQVPTKASGTDYDYDWADPSGAALPVGGSTGQVLTKQSGTDGDADWETPAGGSAATNDVRFTRIGDLSRWNTARARGGTDPARFLFLGDSNVAGQGSGTSTNNLTGAAASSLARRFATNAGFNVDNFMGEQNVTSVSLGFGTYDSRITMGSGWAGQASVSKVVGGRMLQASGGASGKLRFTPVGSFTSFDVWLPQATGFNTAITVSVDGVLVDTFSQAGSSAQLKKTYTVSSGTHYIEIGGGATGNMVVQGIVTHNGTDTPEFIQGGWLGALAIDLQDNTNVWNSRQHTLALDPDFVAIYCTINDNEAATSISDYYTYLETLMELLNGINVNGILIGGYPSNNINTINGRLAQINDFVLFQLAKDYDWFYYDMRKSLGHSYNRTSDLGYAYDNKHPSLNGHNKIGDDLFAFLDANGFS